MRAIYNYLSDTIASQFDHIQFLKQSDRGSVSLLRHKDTGTRFVLRAFYGNGEVYHKLLHIACPHLPQIMEVAEKDGQVLVLEEYIEGDSLDFLLQGCTLPPAKTRDIMLQICKALWVLHCLGAVHRDIKPENILIRGDQVVLIDFDASRLIKPENTEDTQVLGTTGYAAPEQYGITQTDCRADIYSMGVLLNVMLTGKHPTQQTAPGKMGRIVQRCTMTNPRKRYRHIGALMEVL